MSESIYSPFFPLMNNLDQSLAGPGGVLPTLAPFYAAPDEVIPPDNMEFPVEEEMAFAEGGLVPLAGGGKIAIGPGGGLDDLIPTSINGRRAAALSDGEFVVPADVVSMMGDGSSNAGARRLYDLVRQIREAKTGTNEQAGPLPVGTILKRSLR
jgi:hypothetical protein